MTISNIEALLAKLAEFATPSLEIPVEKRALSIPLDAIIEPNISMGIFLQEAFNIYMYALADKEALCSKGLDEKLLEELPRRIDFAREMEARWYVFRYSETPSAKELKRVLAIVDESRKELLAAMEFAFYGDSLAGMVTQIKKGDGTADYAQDLSDIAFLARKNIQKLKDAGCDLIHLDRIDEYSHTYGELVAKCIVEEGESPFVCRDRDMAYTFLFVALEAVRRAARHAFWNDKKRLRGYASEYFRKSSRKKKGKD
jgi:hypothetical protein